MSTLNKSIVVYVALNWFWELSYGVGLGPHTLATLRNTLLPKLLR